MAGLMTVGCRDKFPSNGKIDQTWNGINTNTQGETNMFYWMALLADLQGINLKSSREQTRLLMSFGGVGTRHQCQRWESGWCVGSNLKF